MVDQREMRGHVTTERTSKRLKLQQLFASLGLMIGIGLIIAGWENGPDGHVSGQFALGSTTTVFSWIWLLVVRFRTWWEHG